jgi:adenylate cyclase
MENRGTYTFHSGFTSLSSTIPAQELVTLLNKLFNKFDDIVEAHNLEKIRTIG